MRLRSYLALVAAGVLALAVLGVPRGSVAAEPGSREAINQAAAVNTELALAYMREGNLKAAREKIDKALQQNARTANTQMAAGFIYDKLGDKKKAMSHFEQAVKLGGKDNPDVVANAAVYFCMNGEPKRGEQYMLQAAASPLNRTPDVAYANAGRCARGDGRPQGRRAELPQGARAQPEAAAKR